MDEKLKIVDYHLYCHKCEHYDKYPWSDPCDECLGVPAREFGHKPLHFREKAKTDKCDC